MPLSFSNALTIISLFLPPVVLVIFFGFPKEYSELTLFLGVDLLQGSQEDQRLLELNNLLDSLKL